jgi:hypothetical protein
MELVKTQQSAKAIALLVLLQADRAGSRLPSLGVPHPLVLHHVFLSSGVSATRFDAMRSRPVGAHCGTATLPLTHTHARAHGHTKDTHNHRHRRTRTRTHPRAMHDDSRSRHFRRGRSDGRFAKAESDSVCAMRCSAMQCDLNHAAATVAGGRPCVCACARSGRRINLPLRMPCCSMLCYVATREHTLGGGESAPPMHRTPSA